MKSYLNFNLWHKGCVPTGFYTRIGDKKLFGLVEAGAAASTAVKDPLAMGASVYPWSQCWRREVLVSAGSSPQTLNFKRSVLRGPSQVRAKSEPSFSDEQSKPKCTNGLTVKNFYGEAPGSLVFGFNVLFRQE